MKKLLLIISIAFLGCSKSSDCYYCERQDSVYRYCEDTYYSPNVSLKGAIAIMREDGYQCDYYKD